MIGRCKVIRVKPIRAPSITCTCILKYLAKEVSLFQVHFVAVTEFSRLFGPTVGPGEYI